MPVSSTSRYKGMPVYTVDDPRRGPTATVGIRETTPVTSKTQLFRHAIAGVETIESLAHRYYGMSDAWWRIAEANPLMFPLDLRPGVSLAIPGIDEVGRIDRTRRF